jgi:hypothetical protein
LSTFAGGELNRTVVSYEGIAASLPGGDCRATGLLNVQAERSYFEGVRDSSNPNGSVVVETQRKTVPAGVSVPIDIDGPRRQWHRVFAFSAADVGLQASFRGLGTNFSIGGDRIGVFVRVD